MTTLSASAPPSTTLTDYLRACGGRDILYFDDFAEAGNAAHTLRSRVDEVFVKVEAQYDKVFLTLKDGA